MALRISLGDQLPKGQASDSMLGNIIDERYFDTMNMSAAAAALYR
jgi:hypothetical protein